MNVFMKKGPIVVDNDHIHLILKIRLVQIGLSFSFWTVSPTYCNEHFLHVTKFLTLTVPQFVYVVPGDTISSLSYFGD